MSVRNPNAERVLRRLGVARRLTGRLLALAVSVVRGVTAPSRRVAAAALRIREGELAHAVASLSREKERLERFHAVVATLAAESELERLAPLTLDVLRRAAQADVGAVYVLDAVELDRGLVLREVAGLERAGLPASLDPASGIPRAALAARHELNLPLVHGERTLGVVALGKRTEPRFVELALLERIADAAAVALSHALALEAARHASDVSRAVLETAHDAYIAVDEDMRIAIWSPQAQELFGYAAHEVQGARMDELLIPERWRAGYRDTHERLIRDGAQGHVRRRVELPALRRDSSRVRIELSASPLRVGGHLQINGFVRDISARVARDRAREAQRAVSQALAETTGHEEVMPNVLAALGRCLRWPLAVHWVPDAPAGGMRCAAVWCNPELGGDELERTVHAENLEREAALALRASRGVGPQWIALERHAGEPVAAALERRAGKPVAPAARLDLGGGVAVPIAPGGGVLELWQRRTGPPDAELLDALDGISGLVAHVLERRRAEAEAQRLKDEFFALVSHELRTPLTSIVGYLELLIEEEAGALTPVQRRFLGVIERNAQRLLRLLGDLLFVAQVEAGRMSLARTPVDLEAIVRGAVDAGRPRAERAGIALAAETDDVPALEGDPERLGQVVDNLVSNALKFTPHGGAVTVRAGRRDGRAVIVVSDTGMGVAPAEQGRLFERFYRAADAEERSIPGIGLGLSICRAIVEGHGGGISVASEEGHGATFTVELPIATPAPADTSPIGGTQR